MGGSDGGAQYQLDKVLRGVWGDVRGYGGGAAWLSARWLGLAALAEPRAVAGKPCAVPPPANPSFCHTSASSETKLLR